MNEPIKFHDCDKKDCIFKPMSQPNESEAMLEVIEEMKDLALTYKLKVEKYEKAVADLMHRIGDVEADGIINLTDLSYELAVLRELKYEQKESGSKDGSESGG